MKRKRSWIARFLALVALLAAIAAIVVVAKNADLHSDSGKRERNAASHTKVQKRPRTKAKKYTVESGDTLTSIAHKTGIPVAEIQALNPEVDPQTLIAGEVLKLKK